MQATYRVFVRFISNPCDTRRFTVSDKLNMDRFDEMVRSSFGEDYVEMPDKILYYVNQRVARGETIMVKAEQPNGFFYDDAVIVAYGKWNWQDWTFPSHISKRVENILFNTSNH